MVRRGTAIDVIASVELNSFQGVFANCTGFRHSLAQMNFPTLNDLCITIRNGAHR